jgi:hypothetical protein
MNAYELSCWRGCQDGSELEERLNAERAFSSESDDVAIQKSDAGLDISITGGRAEHGHVFLSIAPSSLLILWTGAEANSSGEDVDIHRSTLCIVPLPNLADPARAVASYHEGRVHLHMPYVGSATLQKTDTLETIGPKYSDVRPQVLAVIRQQGKDR